VAYLEYTLAGKVLQLMHSEVPESLRARALALSWHMPRWSGHANRA